MRIHLIFSSLLISAPLAPCLSAAPEIRDAVTAEELHKKFSRTSLDNPFKDLSQTQVEEGKDPTKVNQPQDLIATSDFLSFGGISTLIPKQAILHVPKNYKDRIQFVRGSRIVVWPEFFRSNRGWIKTVEVTREQAQGIVPLDEKVAEGINKSSIVVVATFKGGPISVLPPKEPEDPKSEP